MSENKTNENILMLRKRYIALRLGGKNNKVAAARVGFSEATGSRVWNLYSNGGDEALMPQQRGRKQGEKTKLSKSQEREIKKILLKSPAKGSLGYCLWTREAISLAIEKRFSIDFPVRTVTDYLHKWGYCPVKPIKKVDLAEPFKYKTWLKTKYPKLKLFAEKGGYEIHWLDANEINKPEYSILSSINSMGEVRFLFYKGILTEKVFVKFMSGLKRDSHQKILLIMYRKEVFPKSDFLAIKSPRRVNVKIHNLIGCWSK